MYPQAQKAVYGFRLSQVLQHQIETEQKSFRGLEPGKWKRMRIPKTTIELHCKLCETHQSESVMLIRRDRLYVCVVCFNPKQYISLSLFLSLLVLYLSQTKFTQIVHFGKLIQSNILPFNFWPKICKGRVMQDTCGGEF